MAALLLLTALAAAIAPPSIPGSSLMWHDAFDGCAGCPPNPLSWTVITNLHVNNEVQEYSPSSANLQLSGGSTLQIIPRLNASSGQWTSARIESAGSWLAPRGGSITFQAALRTGSLPPERQQGMWPAFWLLGDVLRSTPNTPWPLCGELDVFEQLNGLPTAYGTAHCVWKEDGPCHEPHGLGRPVGLDPGNAPDGFHTWSLVIDRSVDDWRAQTIRWYLDGVPFHSLSGSDLGGPAIWSTLAHMPMFVVLNVAVGGDWPGNPNAATADGYGNMMEVQYVAVYESN